ncbi:MAG: SDR family oxidoreductase [Bacteroidia bacterium]|nr:SDR family oxidoreductase [Bacteroidia bacterium]
MNILILGATSGIARAISHRYASQKHRLFLAGRNTDELKKEASDLSIRYENENSIHYFDALKTLDHQQFLQGLNSEIDLVFCVFGYLGDQAELEQNWDMAENSLMVNFVGACSILHHIANDFEKRKSGTIVGISSVAGERGRASNYYYGSAKAGFSAFLSGLRNRLAKSNVHVLTVKPGFVDTPMIEGMETPGILTAQPQKLAMAIENAVNKKSHTLYYKKVWKWIMLLIKNIPEGIFKRLSL